MFPRIDSPCPLKSIQFPKEGNFDCSVCKREVHDLSAMSVAERKAFLRQCGGEVCVSYQIKSGLEKLKAGAVAGVFVVSASGLAQSAMAQEADSDIQYVVVVGGGVKMPQNAELMEESELLDNMNASAEELKTIPVVEEALPASLPQSKK